MAQVVDATDAVAAQQHTFFLLRIGSPYFNRTGSIEEQVVFGRRTLHGHELRPKVVYFLGLREEAMPANVNSAIAMNRRARNAANVRRSLKDNDPPIAG